MRRLITVLMFAFLAAFAVAPPLGASGVRTVNVPDAASATEQPTELLPARARADLGAGRDEGLYLPPIAGASSEIVGTVLPDEHGSRDYYIAVVDDERRRQFWRGHAQSDGHIHIDVAKIARRVVSIALFRHFDGRGHPDEGAVTWIARGSQHIAEMKPVAGIPASGPAIVEMKTVLQRHGPESGVFQAQTRDTEPLATSVMLDGSPAEVDTLAAADRSVVARLHGDARLGARRVQVVSAARHSNEAGVLVIEEHLDQGPPLREGEVRRVVIRVEGAEGVPTQALFRFFGAARVTDGGSTKSVMVNDGEAECRVRASRAGPLRFMASIDAASDAIAKRLARQDFGP